jgi:hypothetical protein
VTILLIRMSLSSKGRKIAATHTTTTSTTHSYARGRTSLSNLRQSLHFSTEIFPSLDKTWMKIGRSLVTMCLNSKVPAPQSTSETGIFRILEVFGHDFRFKLFLVQDCEATSMREPAYNVRVLVAFIEKCHHLYVHTNIHSHDRIGNMEGKRVL